MGRFHRHDNTPLHNHQNGPGTDGPHDDAAAHEFGDMSGYRTAPERIEVMERIFNENDRAAGANRALLDAHHVTAINMMSSPGAGKTSLLQHTLLALQSRIRVGVVEGDIETSIDADRLSGYGAHIVLLNTSNGFGGECHLDAPMVGSALSRLDLHAIDLLFVENVGNLVCPAEFDVGAHHRIMVCSITEGEEKPLKYPVMFRSVDLVLVNKLDLLPHLDFDMPLFEHNLETVNPAATVVKLSARTGEGVEAWLSWLGGTIGGLTPRAG